MEFQRKKSMAKLSEVTYLKEIASKSLSNFSDIKIHLLITSQLVSLLGKTQMLQLILSMFYHAQSMSFTTVQSSLSFTLEMN